MPNRLSQFWQELKRRKVIRTITVYAASAFVILELLSIIIEPLKLPEWTLQFAIVFLCIGFIVAIILSWIYDIHPEEGVVKTEPSEKVKAEDVPKSSNGWKIASYISVVIIIGLLAITIFGRRDKVKIDESLEKSIAVLPFHNLSGDLERDYICEGLTDEIIGNLFKVKSFDKVVSFSSVLNYRDPDRNIPRIAEELGVNYILEGSYKRMEDELKITAQLIEPIDDNHIWLQDYVLPYSKVPGIPGEIALQIADHLKAFITGEEKVRIQRIPTTNQKAYEVLQQAIVKFSTMDLLNYNQLILKAREAIELDPGYADAYAWAGTWTLYRGVYSGDKEITTTVWEAKPLIMKALELDMNSSVAHLAMATIYEWVEWDYIKAEEEYKIFQELMPNNIKPLNSILVLGFFLRMNQLDILQSIYTKSHFDIYGSDFKAEILKGNKSDAKKIIKKRKQEFGNLGFEMATFLMDGYIWTEEYDSARIFLESDIEAKYFNISIPIYQAYLALAYYKTSEYEKGRSIINQLIQRSDTTAVGSPAYFIGWYYSSIGQVDSALYWLDKAVDNRSPEMSWLKVDPAFNSLKDDPSYWDLYERTGHKAYDDFMASKQQ